VFGEARGEEGGGIHKGYFQFPDGNGGKGWEETVHHNGVTNFAEEHFSFVRLEKALAYLALV